MGRLGTIFIGLGRSNRDLGGAEDGISSLLILVLLTSAPRLEGDICPDKVGGDMGAQMTRVSNGAGPAFFSFLTWTGGS